jgi:hypothetical protein
VDKEASFPDRKSGPSWVNIQGMLKIEDNGRGYLAYGWQPTRLKVMQTSSLLMRKSRLEVATTY